MFFVLILRPSPISTLFPYTTLFRSALLLQGALQTAGARVGGSGVGLHRSLRRRRAGTSRGSGHVLSSLRPRPDRKSTRLNSSHVAISYAVFCLKKKTIVILGI